MRTEVKIHFDGKYVPGGAQAVLGPAGCGPDVAQVEEVAVLRTVEVWVTLDVTDERLCILLDLLIQFGVGWWESRRDLYTEEELNRARLLLVWTNGTNEVFGGPRVGTQYNMKDACPTCGAGARQTSAMMVQGSDVIALQRVRVSSTYYQDILVNEHLAGEMEALGARGLSFQDVVSVKKDGSKTKLRWRQLRAARSMPPMSPASTGIRYQDPCASCKRSGYTTWVKEPPRLAYRVQDIADIDDVMTTWEWFGPVNFNGNVSEALFPYPWLLVSPKVMRVIRAAGAPGFDWLPIRVVHEGS